jgi:hypothetical protein
MATSIDVFVFDIVAFRHTLFIYFQMATSIDVFVFNVKYKYINTGGHLKVNKQCMSKSHNVKYKYMNTGGHLKVNKGNAKRGISPRLSF